MTTQEDITAFLELHGWALFTNPAGAIAYEHYETAVGYKEAQIYPIPGEDTWKFSAQYYSQGNNILSTTNIFVSKEACIDSLYAALTTYLSNIEAIIKQSYAVRLLRSTK